VHTYHNVTAHTIYTSKRYEKNNEEVTTTHTLNPLLILYRSGL